MANLFQAAGLDQGAPRPLADILRPRKLSEVVGQDHIVGPDGRVVAVDAEPHNAVVGAQTRR